MDQDKYIESLENLLIFMCKTYVDSEKVLFELAKDGNNALFEVPRIQGTVNTIQIAQLAEIEFQHPEYGFKDIKNEILKKRGK